MYYNACFFTIFTLFSTYRCILGVRQVMRYAVGSAVVGCCVAERAECGCHDSRVNRRFVTMGHSPPLAFCGEMAFSEESGCFDSVHRTTRVKRLSGAF